MSTQYQYGCKILSNQIKKKKGCMTGACEFTIKLVGSNRRLIPTKLGRWCSDTNYRNTKEQLILHFKEHLTLRNIEACQVCIYFTSKQWRGDIDNCSKILLDALQGANIIANDKLVQKLEIERIKGDVSQILVRQIEE